VFCPNPVPYFDTTPVVLLFVELRSNLKASVTREEAPPVISNLVSPILILPKLALLGSSSTLSGQSALAIIRSNAVYPIFFNANLPASFLAKEVSNPAPKV
jgi:hypothetical protein